MKRAPIDYVDHDLTHSERQVEQYERDMFGTHRPTRRNDGLLAASVLLGCIVLLGIPLLAKVVGAF